MFGDDEESSYARSSSTIYVGYYPCIYNHLCISLVEIYVDDRQGPAISIVFKQYDSRLKSSIELMLHVCLYVCADFR